MMQSKTYLHKQVAYLLQKPTYSWFMIGFFAIFPFTSWLSLAIISLVTLRLGWFYGIKCLIVGLTVSLCFSGVTGQIADAQYLELLTYVGCFSCACVLRASSSWQLTVISSVVAAVVVICGVHWFDTRFLIEQYQLLLQVMSTFDQDNLIVKTFGNQSVASQLKLGHYLLGIEALSVLISVMLPLLFARSMQASLFYPGGFTKEMTNFRASNVGCIVLLGTIFGAYQGNLLSISCLPIFFVYVMMAGLSLSLHVFGKKKKLVIYAGLFLPMVLIPYITLPFYVLLGSIDSVFNLRSRWQLVVSESVEGLK